MHSVSSRPSTRPRLEGNNANRRMFASIQSTLQSNKEFKSDTAGTAKIERAPRRAAYKPLILKSVDEVMLQLTSLEKRGEHSTGQIKQNLEASTSTLAEMWDEEWEKLVEVLIKMCLGSDEAAFVVDLLPIFMKYADFLEAFRERMIAVASEFVLGEETAGEKRLEQVPAFLGSLLSARWPRGMHRDTLECNPILFTALEIVRGWVMVLEESNEEGAKAEETSPELLNRCCSGLAALCESQQRSLWLSRHELVDDMYKCFKRAITHNREIDGDVKCSLLHSYMLMNEWTRSKAVTAKCSTTQTASC